MSLLDAAFKAFRSLWTPGIFLIIIFTIVVTLLCLVGFAIVAGWAAFTFSFYIQDGWFAEALRWSWIGAAILAWFLFPGIMPIVVSFFDDKIANAIEIYDYPNRRRIETASFWLEMLHDVGFSLKAVALNILCLPLYLIPGINVVIFYVLNGYLLGREFFVMAARRHLPRPQAEELRRTHTTTIFFGGIILTVLATIPIINLIAPFWGVALATHLFHQAYAGTTIDGNKGATP